MGWSRGSGYRIKCEQKTREGEDIESKKTVRCSIAGTGGWKKNSLMRRGHQEAGENQGNDTGYENKSHVSKPGENRSVGSTQSSLETRWGCKIRGGQEIKVGWEREAKNK